MILTDSILNDIKKLNNIKEDDHNFDQDIIIHINDALDTCRQLGIGPANGFEVTDESQTWGDFFGDTQVVPSTRGYVHAKVKMIFDPPANSFVMDAFKNKIAEFEWRGNVDVETPCLKKVGGA